MTSTAVEHHRVREWLLSDPGTEPPPDRGRSWWKVMCLTGVDYFSTLGYQPGIAALAAGALSPLATAVLILITLFGALPVYRRVAVESPYGEGSLAMLMRMLSFWRAKLAVLVLLGFAATDFMITITLSAADATAHLDENPFWPSGAHGHQVIVTLALIGLLGVVFLRGFADAIGIAMLLVGSYLTLNAVVIADGLVRIVEDPRTVTAWSTALTAQHSDPLLMVAAALAVFPKLALGLSGFETGVAVMPQIRGAVTDTATDPAGRVRGTRRLLTTAAVVMSGFLLTSSIVTTLLIPPAALRPGGPASGRALAYLAHETLGPAFGTVYDLVTIAILWFAGASALAGLLNLIPRYLPRFGMAPEWARASRPLVLALIGVAAIITVIFRADVTAQGGAYATGVLVLITSAAAAVSLAEAHRRHRRRAAGFATVTAVFAYTTVANVAERPDGVKIAACFIGAILVISIVSRVHRSLDLRVTRVQLDALADRFVRDCSRRTMRLVAHEPGAPGGPGYRELLERMVADSDLPPDADVVFVEVTVTDPSDFAADLTVRGSVRQHRYRVLTLESSAIPNALAALLLHIRDRTGHRPHVYFRWSEGNPALNYLRYLLFGHGEVAPVTREILRRQVPDRDRRPHVHAG